MVVRTFDVVVDEWVTRVSDALAGLSDNLTDYHGDEFQLKTGDSE